MTSTNDDDLTLVRSLNDLADAKRWVAWREEERNRKDGSTERTKPPYDPHTGKRAASDNPATWGTRDEAERHWKRMRSSAQRGGGVGIMLGELDDGTHLLGIDLDRCLIAKKGEPTDWAKEVVERFNSYTEVSPSGEGLKIFFLVDDADIDAVEELMDSKMRRVFSAGKHREIALDRGRYYTVTGQRFDDASLRMVDVSDVRWLLEEVVPKFKQQYGAGDSSPNNKAIRDESGSGYGFRFLQDCKRQGLGFKEACTAILKDPGHAGEWARRKEPRDLQRAWDNVVARYVPTHTWDDPDISLLDDRRGGLPAFPLDVIRPNWLQEWIKRASHGAGTTVDHVVVPLFGISSGLIGSARKVRASKSWAEPMTLFCGVVGYSGDGKTPGLNACKGPLDELEYQQQDSIAKNRRQHMWKVEAAKSAREAWKEECKKAIKNKRAPPEQPADADEPQTFIEPRLYVTDSTIETLVDLLIARPTGLMLIVDELTGWFKNMHRYSEGDDRQFWLMAWDGKPYDKNRKQERIKLKNLLVGVVGGMQPDRFAECFKGAADGMYARFLWSWPNKAPYRPLTDDFEEIDPHIVEMFKRLAQLPSAETREQRHIPLSKKARAAFEETRKYMHAHIDTTMGREREWFAKVPAQTLRLAGTLALLNWALDKNKALPKQILAQYIKVAHRLIIDYFWPHARGCLRQIGLSERDANARQVLRYIKSTSLNEFNRERIRRDALSQRLNANDTGALLNQLCDAGWLRRRPKSGAKGRPPILYEVNPKLFEST